MNEEFLHKKITQRKDQNAYRQLRSGTTGIDFCSNDYLGIVKNDLLSADHTAYKSGSTGSRLLTGNNILTDETEKLIADFHQSASALLFNSGYDANTGILSCVPQRGDTVLYDYLSHASIRDGLRLGLAQHFAFGHNDINDLEKKLSVAKGNVFVVTESVFSMDGDIAPLEKIAALCRQYQAFLIIDEAHATGVIGNRGEGLAQQKGLQDACFARVHTFGKAVGCHGAVVMGSKVLRDYLINFSRPFIYTTALPPISIAAIKTAYHVFPAMEKERIHLQNLVTRFQSAAIRYTKSPGSTPIQSVVIPGNEKVKAVAEKCLRAGFDVRAILYPTVPKGGERLRVVLHAFNTINELDGLVDVLSGD